jgi:large subunit ribosomal protein L28
MSRRCDFCGKEPSFGKRVARLGKRATARRVKRRTSRRFDPNVQSVRTVIDGTPRRMKACTSCIKKGKVPPRVTR